MELSDRVKKRRIELGITQDELARRMGYSSRTSINKIENGRPVSQKIIVRLAEALDTTPSYLMGWKNDDDEIGNKLKSLRMKKNISLMELADELHIDTMLLKEYEEGIRKIPQELLEKFASYYNMSVNDLMGIHIGDKQQTAFVTQDRSLLNRYQMWQKEIGYEAHFTNEETEYIIRFAKLLKKMDSDEIEQSLKYMQFLISQRKQ